MEEVITVDHLVEVAYSVDWANLVTVEVVKVDMLVSLQWLPRHGVKSLLVSLLLQIF